MDWELILRNAVRSAVGEDAAVYALAAIGLNMHFGYTGLLNFGQVGFAACGAYGIGIAVATYGLSMWMGIFLGLLAAVVLALLLGLPTLRLRGDYLAIVTIAAGEIIRIVMRSSQFNDVTGGSDGLQAFSERFNELNPLSAGEYGFWVLRFTAPDTWVLIVGWTMVALSSLVVFLLVRSPWGRVVKAIREDEDAVRSLGKNVYAYKMQSLVLGGVIGALSGLVFAFSRGSVQPANYSTTFTFFAYTVLILGGTARVLGPVIGSMMFWLLFRFTDVGLRQATEAGYIPDALLSGTQIGQVRLMLVGLGLMLLMIFRPQGVFGDKNEVAISARR
ncbi:hypothetical protein BH18ACT4_BH18ACT4_02630 [soil metagenome]